MVDDVPNGLDGEALRRWFAPHALARTLITTRSREYGAMAKGIDLSVLDAGGGVSTADLAATARGQGRRGAGARLATDLGYHALALDVTGSALVSSVASEPFGDFRVKLARPDKDALALAETWPTRSRMVTKRALRKPCCAASGLGSARTGLPPAGFGAGVGPHFRVAR